MKDTKRSKKISKKSKKRLKVLKRLCFDVLLFLVSIICAIFLFSKALNNHNDVKVISCSEKSNLDYKVYLFDNNFYEQEYLDMDMVYVASLIDKIVIDFDYKFVSNEKMNIDFSYDIVAKLSILNSSTKKTYFNKTYTLLKDKKVSMSDTDWKDIKEQITIDYVYYNKLANNFKSLYGVDSDSNLSVYMVINKKVDDTNVKNLDDSNTMSVVIPLSERSVDIRLNYNGINESHDIVKNFNVTSKQIIYLIIAFVFIIVILFILIDGVKCCKLLMRQKSPYDKYIDKILKEYDRLIAESASLISFDDKEIVEIKKFTELLDIHDNLQLPIMFYEVNEHELSYFYINHGNELYLFVVDANNLNV